MCLSCVREVSSDLGAIFFDMSVGIFSGSPSVFWWESKPPPAAAAHQLPQPKQGLKWLLGVALCSPRMLSSCLCPCTPSGQAGFSWLCHCCQCLVRLGNLPGSQQSRYGAARQQNAMQCNLKKGAGPARTAQPLQGGVTLWNDRQSLFSLLSLLLRSKL